MTRIDWKQGRSVGVEIRVTVVETIARLTLPGVRDYRKKTSNRSTYRVVRSELYGVIN